MCQRAEVSSAAMQGGLLDGFRLAWRPCRAIYLVARGGRCGWRCSSPRSTTRARRAVEALWRAIVQAREELQGGVGW